MRITGRAGYCKHHHTETLQVPSGDIDMKTEVLSCDSPMQARL